MTSSHPIELTCMESLYLSDSVSMYLQGPPETTPGHDTPFPNLLLKIGGAVLETDQQSTPVTIFVNLSELWMMREITKSSVVVGNERVGVNLLLKIYAGIRAMNAGPDMDSIVGILGEVEEMEPGKSSYAAQLERIRDGGDLSVGGTTDDPNTGDNGTNISDQNGADNDTPTTT